MSQKRFAQEASLEFKNGDIIFLEGEESQEMYVVQEGSVEILKKTDRGEVLLATLRKGDFLGEMSLLESLPRSATARSKGVSRLLSIQPGGFLLKIRRDPTFAFEMLQALSRRIRSANEKLVMELRQEGITSDRINQILDKTEFR